MHPVSGEMVLMPHSGQWHSNMQYICLITCRTPSNCARLTYLLAIKFSGIDYYIVYVAQRNLFLSSNPDSPTFYEAMNGPQSNQYREAMQLEIETFERQHTWVSCLRPKDHHVLKSTWAFILKRLPDGTSY
jgi:hypothetical protein